MTVRRTKRSDGRYTITFTFEGKRYFGYGRTQAEAKADSEKKRERLQVGAPVRDSSRTVGAWLEEWQRDLLPASDLKSTTQENYKWLLKTLVKSDLAGIPLAKLLPGDIVKMLSARTDQRPGQEGVAVADSTRRACYAVLRAALDDAVSNNLIRENPIAKVKRPSGHAREESRALAAVEVALFLEHAADLRYLNVYKLALWTGMRRGELAGLKWADIDFEKSTLTVRSNLARVGGALVLGTPKTKNSRRTLKLNQASLALLTAHRAVQDAERLEAGNLWQDTGHVFVTTCAGGGHKDHQLKMPGNPVDPNNLSRGVRIAVRRAGLSDEGGPIGIHSLRHTFATVKLNEGVAVHRVSRILGHSSIAITGDIYGHLIDDPLDDAMERGSAALGF